jgi:hypothetical protein
VSERLVGDVVGAAEVFGETVKVDMAPVVNVESYLKKSVKRVTMFEQEKVPAP